MGHCACPFTLGTQERIKASFSGGFLFLIVMLPEADWKNVGIQKIVEF
jgi:hypothetical protein